MEKGGEGEGREGEGREGGEEGRGGREGGGEYVINHQLYILVAPRSSA